METQLTAGYFLSPQQSYLWLLQQRLETQFSTQIAILIEGELDESQLRKALREVVSRHEILRTAFPRRAGMKTPFQVILESSDPHWEACSAAASPNLREATRAWLLTQSSLPFDFEQGPLLRALLIHITSDKHVFILTAPTLCADSSSLTTLVNEIICFYSGRSETLSPEPLRYIQFAQWQSELLQGNDETAMEGKTYWQLRRESGEQQIDLPYEARAEVAGQQDRVVVPVSAASFAQITSLAVSADTSGRDILLTAWQSLIFRLTGKSRLAVGAVLPGREYEELGDAVGLVAKMLPIHVRFEGNPSFMEILGQTKSLIADAVGCQEYLDPANAFTSDATIAFSYTSVPSPHRTAALRHSVLRLESRFESCKLKLCGVEQDGNLELEFYYDASRYQRSDVEQLSQSFMTLLAAAVVNPGYEVARLPLLSEAAVTRQLYEWNRTESRYPQETMHALIEQQVERTPERLAVRCGDQVLTYAELNRRANQLAHHLHKLGVKPNSLVGLCLDRSVDMMVAVLAILKAGGAYISISGDHPKPRLAQQLEGAAALITEQKLSACMPERFGSKTAGPIILLDTDAQQWAHLPGINPEAIATPDDLAYVIYTSGSTGTPKGVGVRHRNLVNYSWGIAQQVNLADHPEGLQFATVSTLGADLGNTCIYPALLSGGGLHIISYDIATDAQQMADYQAQHPVDVLKIVPSHLAALLHSPDGAKVLPRKYLITGGEALTRSLVEEIEASGAACQLINHYGPTETTVGSLIQPLSGFDWKLSRASSVPIGRPLANTQVYVLDSLLQPVPEGVTGELYISGDGVAAGYLGQPELTAQRFLPNLFVNGSTMYRTGDLVRHIPNAAGAIEFLGRADDQVKIRGFRIELGEIETALLLQIGVKQAVVLAQETEGRSDKQLVAYVVTTGGDRITGEHLRQQLKEQLPDYMVPSAVILLEKIPLTPNGKIDRKALPSPEAAAVQKTYVEPSTPTEQAVAGIWAEVLQRNQISADDNFFDLGGHSLMATQVISRIRQQFSVEIALRTLFESPVLKDLAEAVDSAKASDTQSSGPIRRVSRDAYRTAGASSDGSTINP